MSTWYFRAPIWSRLKAGTQAARLQSALSKVLHCRWGAYQRLGDILFSGFQMPARAGYAVLAVNDRGSSGYRDPLCTKLFEDRKDQHHKEVMAGAHFAIEKGGAGPRYFGFGIDYVPIEDRVQGY